jgi:hypothetical protein
MRLTPVVHPLFTGAGYSLILSLVPVGLSGEEPPMQTAQPASAPAFVPRPSEGRPAAAQLAEFRFESDAALERALALAAAQSWIAGYTVDRVRRTLRVTLAGVPQRTARRRAEATSVH